MGHRLSKTTVTSSNVDSNNKSQRKRSSTKIDTTNVENVISERESKKTSSLNLERSLSGPTISVITDTQTFCFKTCSESSSSSNGPKQFIIKIKLAKMKPGESDVTSPSSSLVDDDVTGSNNNLNVERSNMTENAISFSRNITCDQGNEEKLNNLNGGSLVLSNNNNNNNNNNFVSNFSAVPFVEEDSDEAIKQANVKNFNIMLQQMESYQIINNSGSDSREGWNNNDRSSNRSSTSSSEFTDADADADADPLFTTITGEKKSTCKGDGKNPCCHLSKSSSPSTTFSSVSSSSSAYPSRWRCRDALKKFRPSCSKKQNENSQSKTSQRSEKQQLAAASLSSTEMHRTHSNHLALWSPGNDVIIPLASPQIVVLQYPISSAASPLVTLAPIANLPEHAIRLMSGDLAIPTTPDSSSSMAASPCSTPSSATTPNGTVVHSQVDYIHCLVPDLERITKSTYYWGKMDRYEAERLLEGKPEGTFLLRDSAQEEYLFSVTFRKYGRSLHARIEQFNHQFSFDCHDPGVYTASTVTGLLEHYKDPSIVMFFEPMLTIPLHRNKSFSLQQLCRATIVSQTTYDGISELEIPIRLKSYLKEYHYKQRVRVKPFDESFYTCA